MRTSRFTQRPLSYSSCNTLSFLCEIGCSTGCRLYAEIQMIVLSCAIARAQGITLT